MTVAAYRDRTTGRYPITLAEIRARVSVLFGDQEPPEAWVLDEANADPVIATDPPAYDPATQTLTEGAPARVGGEWRQTWTVATIPPPPEVFAPISDRQFFQALAMPPYAIIQTQEALDAVKTGEVPAVMQAVIDALPADDQFAATMLVAGATEFYRDNRLVEVFGASQGMNAAQINAFWRFAEGL